jgi:spore coat protein U domain-containing protein, fimbrial subunit CupE1/2/3/6
MTRLMTRTEAGTVLSIVAGMMFAAGSLVSAGSATSSLSTTGTVANNCTISTAAVAFGSYDPVVANASANLDGTGSLTVACTKGAATTFGLDLGSNASGSTRRLTDGASNYLTYQFYQDSGRSTVWGNSGADLYTPAAAPSKAARVFTVYGRVPSNQDVPAGSYSDTVTATVNF